jgi:RHS repeat-associated protein
MSMQGREYSVGEYRYGFNGAEKDNEVKGFGNSIDFGARMYDSRIGRWMSLDPLMKKYPDLSPYTFTGNNPIKFLDFDGKDFGIKIDNDKKTIIIIANVYTTSKVTYNQAKAAAANWNAKSATVDGYIVTFQIKVKKPSKGVYSKEILSQKKEARNNAAWAEASSDNVGNEFAGLDGHHSLNVSGNEYEGGVTENGKHISMHNHEVNGDMGNYPDLVTHEFGHLFGLDDEDGNKDGKTDTYYGGKNGIMEYSATNLSPISDNDVKTILNFAKDALAGETSETDAKVTVISQKGKSDGSNPIGLKNEK